MLLFDSQAYRRCRHLISMLHDYELSKLCVAHVFSLFQSDIGPSCICIDPIVCCGGRRDEWQKCEYWLISFILSHTLMSCLSLRRWVSLDVRFASVSHTSWLTMNELSGLVGCFSSINRSQCCGAYDLAPKYVNRNYSILMLLCNRNAPI